jgi:hypothetical protein
MMGAYECLIIVRDVKGQHAAATTEGAHGWSRGVKSQVSPQQPHVLSAGIGAEKSGTNPRPDISR